MHYMYSWMPQCHMSVAWLIERSRHSYAECRRCRHGYDNHCCCAVVARVHVAVFMFAIMTRVREINAVQPNRLQPFYGVNLVFMLSGDAIFYMDKSHIVAECGYIHTRGVCMKPMRYSNKCVVNRKSMRLRLTCLCCCTANVIQISIHFISIDFVLCTFMRNSINLQRGKIILLK